MKMSSALAKKLQTYRISFAELQEILKLMKRPAPIQNAHQEWDDVQLNPVEWAVFSALWSEHCSYKSSKIHLRKFAQTLDASVVNAEGENAGVIDLGQGERIVFKMESHNHPSFIEPYQGAATGVGGILRDIFTMGARPIASADYLCFGDEFSGRMGLLVDGVVRGIGGYGNSVGVPTITGQTNFHPRFEKNILVNAMSVGLLRKNEKVALSAAKGVGNQVVYVGAKTGKDGVHGAAMASESFDANSDAKKPNVQIGDPYFEKLLIESCLEVLQQDLVVAIQDMGAAGLTSSSFEMASKGQVGMRLNLDLVPVRDSTMQADEILLSESQERMLMVVEPHKVPKVQSLFQRWGLDAVVVGEIQSARRVQIYFHGEKMADLDPDWLVENCPRYSRPFEPWKSTRVFENPDDLLDAELMKVLQQPMGLKDWLLQKSSQAQHAAKTPLYQQYDQRVGLLTARGADHDVGVLRLPDSARGLALTVGCRPWLMEIDARLGALDAVLYPSFQMSLKGFVPKGLTDCLNFGNPEKIEIMNEFVASVDAIVETSLLLQAPVVSGNVSFYNETLGQNIISTPAIGVVGLREDIRELPEDVFLAPGLDVWRLSHSAVFTSSQSAPKMGFCGDFGASQVMSWVQWMKQLRLLSQLSGVRANQMVSQGGLLLSLVKMVQGGVGCKLTAPLSVSDLLQEVLYQSVWVVEKSVPFGDRAKALGLQPELLGQTQLDWFEVREKCKISVQDWQKLNQNSLRRSIESLA